jgi:hypothetical protein
MCESGQMYVCVSVLWGEPSTLSRRTHCGPWVLGPGSAMLEPDLKAYLSPGPPHSLLSSSGLGAGMPGSSLLEQVG